MSAKVLVPLSILGGLAAAVGIAVVKAKKAKASPLEAKPKKEAEKVTPSMVIDEYNRAMSADVQDIDYLQRVSEFLDENGQSKWAANVIAKIRAIQASKGAAMAQAQADVAKQAAATEAEIQQGKQAFEQALGKKPTQEDVDKMYAWAIDPDTGDAPEDLAPLQQAYQMVIAYDQTAAKGTRIELLGDKLAKVKAGVYSSVAAKATPKVAAQQETVIVKETGLPAETAVAVTKEEEEEEEEPTPGAKLPELPPEPSPIPVGVSPPTPTEAASAAPDLAKEETSAPADPNRTIALARALIDVEDESGWKPKLKALVKNWQGKVGLTADGKFGPGSALRMGEEVGVLPLVRYWPLGTPTKAAGLEKYRGQLYELADRLDSEGKKAHAEAIRASAEHEKGQAWPKSPAPVVSATGEPLRMTMLDKLLTKLANAEV